MLEIGINLTPLSPSRAVLAKNAPAARPPRFGQFPPEPGEPKVPGPPGRECILENYKQRKQPLWKHDLRLLHTEYRSPNAERAASNVARKSRKINSPTFWRTAIEYAFSGPARPNRPDLAPTLVGALARTGNRPSITKKSRPRLAAVLRQAMTTASGLFVVLRQVMTRPPAKESNVPLLVTETVTMNCA